MKVNNPTQRAETECAICVVAFVMGHPYSYERVLRDSGKYAKVPQNGNFCWWLQPYLWDEGFLAVYRPFLDLYQLPRFRGCVVGLLGMDIPHMRTRHFVLIDELGVIDPADNVLDHREIGEYVLSRKEQGVIFNSEFLAVKRKVRLC